MTAADRERGIEALKHLGHVARLLGYSDHDFTAIPFDGTRVQTFGYRYAVDEFMLQRTPLEYIVDDATRKFEHEFASLLGLKEQVNREHETKRDLLRYARPGSREFDQAQALPMDEHYWLGGDIPEDGGPLG